MWQLATSWHDKRKKGWRNEVTVAMTAAGGRRQLPMAWCGAGVRRPRRRKWEFSGNGNNVGMIDRNFNIGNVLHELLFICTLRRSLVTSRILALSKVKAFLFRVTM
jgi:hypothetical protein